MADSSNSSVVRPSFRRHNSYVQFSFIPQSNQTNSYKLTRLNAIFEKAADRRLGGIRADKIVRLLPTSAISREKYLSILGDLGIDLQTPTSNHKSKKGHHARVRVISRGPFLAMFAYESVSFLNLFALNEKADREKRLEHRRSTSSKKKSHVKVTSEQPRERSSSAPPSNGEATDLYREQKHRSKHKRRKKKKLGQKEKHTSSGHQNQHQHQNQRRKQDRENASRRENSKSKSHPKGLSKPEALLDIDVNVDNNQYKNIRIHSNKAQKSFKQKRILRHHSSSSNSNSSNANFNSNSNANSNHNTHQNINTSSSGKVRERQSFAPDSYTSSSFSSHSSEDATRKRLQSQHQDQDESSLNEIKPISYSYSSSSSESEMPSPPPTSKNKPVHKPKNQRKKKHYDVYDRLLQIDVDFSNLSIKEQERHMELQRKMYKKYKHKYIAQGANASPKYDEKDFKDGDCVFFRHVSSFITKLFPSRGSAVVGVAPSPEMGYSKHNPRHLQQPQSMLVHQPLPHLIHRRQSA